MRIISKIYNFDNIGGKIKNLAKWSCWITILLLWIATPILILVAIAEGGDDAFAAVIVCPIAAAIASFSIWLGSWAMYAFGELVEKTADTENSTRQILNKFNETITLQAAEALKYQIAEEAKHKTEAKANRESEEKATCETVEKVEKQEKTPVKKENPLAEKLEYALRYQTDEGMITFLTSVNDEAVQAILKEPSHLVRKQIQNLLEQL